MAFSPQSASRVAHLLVTGRRWIVLAMLLALHAALVAEPGAIFQRLWLLVHFGLFLLWQPFFEAERELEVLSVVLLVAITATTLYFVSGWMIVMWLLLLLGILGGRVFTLQAAKRTRFYLMAFGYVLVLLLLWAVPILVLGTVALPEAVGHFVQRVMPLFLVMLMLLPLPREDQTTQVFDFFYAVLVFQLGVVLVLGSIALLRYTGDDYIDSVVFTVLGFGGAMIVFAVLWNPMRGFGGLRTYFSAYLMSVGMPFEMWMRRVAELAEVESDPQRFLELALKEIAAFPWMRGGRWRSAEGEGQFGESSGHATRFTHSGLQIVFYTEIQLSPALFLHMRLLARVVGEFHDGKRRETTMRRHAYLEAVHETGARLTHDVKNLLQSLLALTSMAPKESADGYMGLLQRQLPQLTKRLQATVEKLQSPELATAELALRASAWWQDVERRLAGGDVALEGNVEADGNIPATLFDSFLENALENASHKRAREKGIEIRVRFVFSPRRASLSICDTGSAVPPAVVQRLFREPLDRASGLGIGLFHVARLATQSGYTVTLSENRDGAVCFALEREEPAG